MASTTQRVDEADARRVNVEHTDGDATRTESMHDVRRHRDEGPGADAMPFAVLEELDLALEYVKRVGVVGVGVRVDTFEPRLEGELDHLQVWQLAEDATAAVAAVQPLALARPREERLLHGIAS